MQPIVEPGFLSVCEVISVGPAESWRWYSSSEFFFTEQVVWYLLQCVNIAGKVHKPENDTKINSLPLAVERKLHYILVGANPSCTLGLGYIVWCCQDESSAVWGVVKAPELFKAVGCVVLPRPSQASAVLERQNQVGREHLLKMQWKSASILMVH